MKIAESGWLAGRVGELQGLYGPMQIWEDGLQRLWVTGGYRRGDWRTEGGERVEVLERGAWNRGAGPDIKGARIRIGERELSGDVEVHLYREDWWRHGHNRDLGYNGVVLHVVGFRGLGRAVEREDGERIEEWWCGPWVDADWEGLMGRLQKGILEVPGRLEGWARAQGVEAGREALRCAAAERWRFKASHAAHWVAQKGWESAQRRLFLYSLGYPENRAAFLEIAERFEDADWRYLEQAVIAEAMGERVRWRCGRPANHAERRMASYLRFCAEGGEARLAALAGWERDAMEARLRGAGGVEGLAAARQWWETLLGGAYSRGMGNRLMVDGLMPLLAGAGQLGWDFGQGIWWAWPVGTVPDRYRDALKLLGIGVRGGEPMRNGWVQGMIRTEERLLLAELGLPLRETAREESAFRGSRNGFPVPLR